LFVITETATPSRYDLLIAYSSPYESQAVGFLPGHN